MLPIIKVFDIDYSFIIKNYLNPEMWEKEWTLFVYKTFVITLKITYIHCEDEEIVFRIKIKDNNPNSKYKYSWGFNSDKYRTNTVRYSLKIEDCKFLINKINSGVIELIKDFETDYTRGTNGYSLLEKQEEFEKNKLEKIAIDFLDSIEVTNEDIRDAYVSAYLECNSKIENYKINFLAQNKYKYFSDLILIFVESTHNEELIKKTYKEVEEYMSSEDFKDIKEIVSEYIDYMNTEEFENEMKDKLESI